MNNSCSVKDNYEASTQSPLGHDTMSAHYPFAATLGALHLSD